MARPSWNSEMYILQTLLLLDKGDAVICHKM